jgi:hypothetical protein
MGMVIPREAQLWSCWWTQTARKKGGEEEKVEEEEVEEEEEEVLPLLFLQRICGCLRGHGSCTQGQEESLRLWG